LHFILQIPYILYKEVNIGHEVKEGHTFIFFVTLEKELMST